MCYNLVSLCLGPNLKLTLDAEVHVHLGVRISACTYNIENFV